MTDRGRYNPLDTRNLRKSVADALLGSDAVPLGDLSRFSGAGIYAIYYSGDFPAYKQIAQANRDGRLAAPIYVGKAVPPGSRKGGSSLGADPGPVLFGRLNEHATSIRVARNLNIDDFHCRYLVVDDIWIPLGESLLVARFSPIWNKLVDGFGNHDPGSGRRQQARSRWDVLHPGRTWAEKLVDRKESASQIGNEVANQLQAMTAGP